MRGSRLTEALGADLEKYHPEILTRARKETQEFWAERVRSKTHSRAEAKKRAELESELIDSNCIEPLRAELAPRYIESFSIEAPAPYKRPALDKMTSRDAKAVFDAPWPTAQLRIVVKDPRWIDHINASSYEEIPIDKWLLRQSSMS